MFKNREDRLRATQSKLTTAAGTIRKNILNDSEVRKEFTKEEIEAFEIAELALREFKNKVKHAKEKHIRAKKAAERLEANILVENTRKVARVVKSLPVNSLFELSIMEHYISQDLGVEGYVSAYQSRTLKNAKNNPVELEHLLSDATERATELLLKLLPNQQHRSGFDPDTDEINYYYIKPTPCTDEYITDLVKKHIIHVHFKKAENIEYVNEATRLVNLARKVNQTVKDLSSQSKRL